MIDKQSKGLGKNCFTLKLVPRCFQYMHTYKYLTPISLLIFAELG